MARSRVGHVPTWGMSAARCSVAAGLAAAVYGASEGPDTVVIEQLAIGGQAGTSSLIRNYLGFSTWPERR